MTIFQKILSILTASQREELTVKAVEMLHDTDAPAAAPDPEPESAPVRKTGGNSRARRKAARAVRGILTEPGKCDHSARSLTAFKASAVRKAKAAAKAERRDPGGAGRAASAHHTRYVKQGFCPGCHKRRAKSA